MVDLWADGVVVNLSAGTIERRGRLVRKQGRARVKCLGEGVIELACITKRSVNN